VNEDGYQFRVGDIVREKEFITIGTDEQMTGIVLAVESTSFLNERVVHDRLTIMWIETGAQEEMPDVLVELVSSVVSTKKLKKP
tara:strand:+ start:1179 stop:1430 length:252 start_codon:yes stop_codon:yes gene_type:complete